MRGIEHLHPQVREIAERLQVECARNGLKIKITDTWRTKAEQDALYAQGRTKPGVIVTGVRYPWSNHNWGVAFDFCRDDGKKIYENSDGFFEKVGAIGKKLGLYWGGDWPTFKDRPHFESKKPEHLTENLVKKYSNPENFKKTWQSEEERMEKIKIVINGKVKIVDAISKDGQNYVKLRDLQSDNIQIGYKDKMPAVVTK